MIEEFRVRWRRWLGQMTRSDRSSWIELLSSNLKGWATKTLRKHKQLVHLSVGYPNFNSIEEVKGLFAWAIACADMEDLQSLDKLFCSEKVEKEQGKCLKK